MTGTVAGAVIFDMDGVLLDSGAHHRDAWRRLLADLGVEPAPDFWRRTIGRPAEEAVAQLLDRPVEAAEAAALARRKREHYAELTDARHAAGGGRPGLRDDAGRRPGCRARSRRPPRATTSSRS